MLVESLDSQTQFLKGIIQGLFKQSLVPIGPVISGWRFKNLHPLFLFLVTVAMLVGGRVWRTQFWKGINHRPFHQSLVLSDQVVLEENIF